MHRIVRHLVPRKLQTLLGFYKTFNHVYGHSRVEGGLIQSGQGAPLPWMTYPFIEYISTLDLSDCRVFEYGSGSSTLFWASRTRQVVAVERERSWYDKVNKMLPGNATLIHCGNELEYAAAIDTLEEPLDIIVIDGAVRFPSMQRAVERISDRGIIVLDNTEWYPNLSQHLRDSGYSQIDFSGFGPLNAFPSCTSLFFKDTSLLERRLIPPEWKPMGGIFLTAHDDVPLEQIDFSRLQILP